jgi:cation:H+ antiporter
MDFAVFAACAIAIAAAGTLLVDAVDAVGKRTGIGHVFLGGILLAGATSLPEIVSVTSAGALGEADLAIGTVLGSNLFNLTIFGVIALASPLAIRPSPAGVRAGLAAFTLGVVVLVFLLVDEPTLGQLGLGSVVLIGLYGVSALVLFRYDRAAALARAKTAKNGSSPTATGATPEPETNGFSSPHYSLRGAIGVLLASSAVVFVAAVFLADAADGIARELNVTGGVVGVVGVAFATSLPEVVTSVAALRKGASGLVVGNVFGSNLFNLAVIFPSDIAFDGGAVIDAAQNEQAATAAFGLLLMGLAVFALRDAGRGGEVGRARRSRGVGLLILLGYLGGMSVAVTLGT